MNKSFTLIEILVVIIVIGILSTFILVGINSITTNADFTKRKAFSNSIRNALLINLVSEWKLNEGSGQIASDSWKENHGTLGSTSGIDVNDPTWKTLEECVSDDCLSFDGSFDYVNFENGEGLDPSSITVEAWFKSSGTLFDWATIINKGAQADNNHFWLHYMSGTGIRFEYGNGSARDRAVFNTSIITNRWYHVVGTYGNGYGYVYINGVRGAAQTSITGDLGSNSYNLIVGRGSTSNAFYWNGYIDEIRFYGYAMPSSEIQENYYSGLNKLAVKRIITGQEFNQRIGDLKFNLAKEE